MSGYSPYISGKVLFSTLRAGCIRGFSVVGFFSSVINLLALTLPIYMLSLFDRVLSTRNMDTLILLTIMAVCAIITMAILEVIRRYLMVQMGIWFDQKIREPALMLCLSSSAERGNSTSSGITKDISTFRQLFRGSTIITLFDAPWSPIFLLIIFLLHPILGFVALTGTTLVLLFGVLQDRISQKMSENSRSVFGKAKQDEKTLFSNAEAATAMGMSSVLTQGMHRQNREKLDLEAREALFSTSIKSAGKFVKHGQRIAMLFTGVILIFQDEITTGAMMAGVILGGRAIGPATRLIKSRRSIVTARAAYLRIKKALQQVPDRRYGELYYSPQGELSVQRLTFRYSGTSKAALHRINFEVQPGELMGVVGPTGSGRSTLGKLIVGILRPRSGQVHFGGSDIANFANDIRAVHIGYAPQEPQLFDGTVYENISRMRVGVQDVVVAAAKLAGVHDAILRLPDGYDTMIGPTGVNLAKGELQRISLARAVFGDPRLVVLDEPSLDLDKEGEKSLVKMIRALKDAGVIVIVISHRSSILGHMDKVLKLPSGDIISSSSKKESREKSKLHLVEAGKT
jgi:ATP-binding cassette subfamily B protein/ATP-binding cassette subfamily C protein